MSELLFLFSMPRSGSTWLQRILASNSQIQSAPETWLLLPLFEVVIKGNALTEYNQSLANLAIDSFFADGMDSRNAYHRAIVQHAGQALLARCENNEAYFLEKTPRNHLFCDLVPAYFPNARSIFLWRDPAEIALSIARTWGGKWDVMARYEVDFVVGLNNLITAAEAAKDRSIQVRYSDLKRTPKQCLSAIYAYLDIVDGASAETELGRRRTTGTMGDQPDLNGNRQTTISRGERANIKRLLDQVSDQAFDLAGANRPDSLEKLYSAPVRMFEPRDLVTPIFNAAYRHQLAPELKRLRGGCKAFPRLGVE